MYNLDHIFHSVEADIADLIVKRQCMFKKYIC